MILNPIIFFNSRSLTWESSNGISTGENSIIKILNDVVIQDFFLFLSIQIWMKNGTLQWRINYKKGAKN